MSLKVTNLAVLVAGSLLFAAPVGAQVMVGGAPMYATKTIAENAPEAPNLTTLVAAVKAAGLVETLGSPGPFTVFAPTNRAFEKLPAGTVDTLVKPENKAMLTEILTYHVVPGTYSAEKLMAGARKKGGLTLTTVAGKPITLKMSKGKLVVIDQKGGGAVVQTADVNQSNGVVHVIGSVLLPK
ncbi:hypothetical protein ASG43_17085 [Aureimonas sp. Leaf454]|uniref:fasciclin domain-containing protein n=1 Tax=Aureimonas sp. Leaf454 TaxID=1736381 RepID=UPI0006F82968|nr:fasciclin domain-containing protein [Aureimonas sp. Leaf454]KQT41997.1 hypothetical protein ASG43_17085 [Aureimonas sp. Leaf454]